ncbi:uncharacterized protein LOC130625699 [Hydractinia symbiolongicarpus]|uniref:uncharacterized protein LOC130625699 n=1 Tax=Hydractinia symbiolongicarpus TaxID=13093 RepID=UPI00254BCAC7|nr:uncharacterized protein LOC130625699 [Hydractinia symbiolongicarpus]
MDNGRRYKCHCNDGDWKPQATNICFGAKDNSYGNFSLSHTGILTKLKLEHTGATNLTCNTLFGITPSRWGCTADPPGFLKIVITDNENTIIIPKSQPDWGYYIPGYHGQSAVLEFDNLNINANKDKELRIWYTDDLKDEAEYDNVGTSCTNVHAVFCD